ncbi:hypothetical protein ASE23_26510 [Rhizobium sp. Root73]|nr:hypothetical protein ASE23_26510 [Rhizobium sp. Root73]
MPGTQCRSLKLPIGAQRRFHGARLKADGEGASVKPVGGALGGAFLDGANVLFLAPWPGSASTAM